MKIKLDRGFPPLYEVVQRVLIGFVAALVFTGVWWLVTGSLPDGAELWFGSAALIWAGSHFLDAREKQEIRKLHEMYESPASDEK